MRAFRRDYAHAPDLVAFPRGEGELVSVLDWCSGAGATAIPFGGGAVSCRFAYVYPDGPAPGPSRPGTGAVGRDQARRSEAILALGGTITYHHAVGRDHPRWYLREVPHLFTGALKGAKAELDLAGIMNPGVLLQPAGAVSYSHEGAR